MANQRIDIDVGLKVDKTGLNQIKSSLQEIKNLTAQDLMKIGGHTDIQKAEQELKSLKASISQIDGALEKAFNTDLGTLNVSKFNQALKGMNLNQVYKDFSAAGAAGQTAFRNVTSQILTTNMQLKQTHNFLNNMATTMANTVKWGVASSVMNNFTGSVQKAYGYVKSLNTSLNDIRIVTGASADEMERFAVKANNAAKELGKSTTDYTEAALIYYQQGLSDEEVAARAETTLKAANVTGQSGQAVSEQLTAVWNGYKVSAEEAELYIDKLAAVAATTASDLEELSTGMSKVASAANLMGVDIDSLNAQMATIVSVTRQAPESVGTALKTIYARMGDIEAGLDAETTLGNYTEEMKAMGVNVLDANGKLRDMGDVINEIGGNWKNMTREQQLSLSQTMAGTRQYNNLLSLFDNWDMYTEALNTSANAAGTLQKQQDTYMESTQAHLNQLRAASEDLYDSLLDPKGLNPVIDGLTLMTNLFSNFVDSIGGGGGVLLAFGSIGTKVFSQQLASGIATFITNMQNAKENANQLRAELEILGRFKNAGLGDDQIDVLVKMKERVLDLNKSITAEERNIANQYINQQNEIFKEQDALEARKKAIEETYKTMTGENLSLNGKYDAKGIAGELEEQAKETRRKQASALEEDTHTAATKGYEELKQATQNWIDTANLAGERAHENEKANNDLTEAVNKHNSALNNALKAAQDMVKNDDFETESKKKLIEELEKLDKLRNKDGTLNLRNQKVIEQLAKVEEARIGVYERQAQAAKKQAESVRGLGQATAECAAKADAAKRSFNNFLTGIELRAKIQQSIQLVSSFGQLASAITTVSRIGSIWSNEDLSMGEKMLQTVTNLGFAIPMLVNSLSQINTAFGLGTTLSGAHTAALVAETAATITVDGATKGLTLSKKQLIEASSVANTLIEKGVAAETAYQIAALKTAGVEAIKIKMLALEQGILDGTIAPEAAKVELDLALAGSGVAVGEGAMVGATGLKAFWTALGPIALIFGAVAGLSLLVAGFNKVHISAKEAGEAVSNSLSELESSTTELENLESSLQGVQDKLDELYAKGELSITDKEDIANLERERIELETQLALQKEINAEKQKAVVSDVKQALDKGTYDYEGRNKQSVIDAQGNASSFDATSEETKDAWVEGQVTRYGENFRDAAEQLADKYYQQYHGEITSQMMEDLDSLQNALDAATATGDNDAVDKIKAKIEEIYSTTGMLDDTVLSSVDSVFQEDIAQQNQFHEALQNGDPTTSSGWTDEDLAKAGLAESQIEALKAAADAAGISLDTLVNTYKELGNEEIAGTFENNINKIKAGVEGEGRDFYHGREGAAENVINEIKDEKEVDDNFINRALENIDWSSIDYTNFEESLKQAMSNAVEEQLKIDEENEEKDFQNKTKTEAEAYDLDLEELESYQDLLLETNEALEENSELLLDASVAGKRFSKGVNELGENWDDFNKIMTDSNATVEELSEIMPNVNSALQDMLDYSDEEFEMLPPDFAQKHWDKIEDVVNGVDGAYEDLLALAAEEIIFDLDLEPNAETELINAVNGITDAIDVQDLEVGATLDDTGFTNVLNTMIENGEATATDISNALKAIQFNPEIDYKEVDVNTVQFDKQTGTAEVIDPITGDIKTVTAENIHNFAADGVVRIPTINGSTTTYKGPSSKARSSGSNKKPSGKKGGGGGGGSKKKKEEHVKTEKDRYHDVNVKLKQIDKELEDIGRDQEKYFGKDLIKALNKELDILERQKDVYKEKLDIAKQEQKELQKSLKSDGVKFNKDGTISNYEKALQAQEDALNKLIDKYNKLPASKQEKFKEEVLDPAKEAFEEFKENIERYDELLLDEIPEIEDSLQKIADREIEINVQKLKMEVEIRLDLSEAEKDWNEFQREVIDGIDSDDILGNAQSDKNLYETLLGNGTLEGETNKIKNIMKAINDINTKGSSEIYGDNKQLAMDDLKEAMDEIMGSMTDLNDLKKNIDEAYLDMIDEMGDAFDNQTESLEYVNELLEHNVNLTELLHGEDAYAEMAKHYEDIVANNLKIITANQEAAAFYKNKMQTETDPEAAEKWKELWKDAIAELNDSVENSIQTITDQYMNSIDLAFDKMKEKLASLVGDEKNKDFGYYSLEWELANEEAEKYLGTMDKAYELQKLGNKYQKSINDTSSVKAQRELNKLMDEEMKKLREKDKLTQYDIDRANARYELKLKEIALEEAQQNKSQMRLRRDSSGNYSYQFVADEEAIANAEQEVADATHSLFEMDRDEMNQKGQEYLDTMQEWNERLKEVDIEDKEARELINKEYQERLNNIKEDYLAIEQNLIESAFIDRALLYDEDIAVYQAMSDKEREILMNEMVPTWDTGVRQMMNAMVGPEGLGPTCEKAMEDLKDATDTYNESLAKIESTAKTTFDTTKTEYTENITLANDLVKEAKDLVTETQNELTAVNDLKDGVDTLATSYETVYQNATNALTAAQNLWKAEQEHAAEEAKKNNPDPDGDGDKTTTTEGKKDNNEGKTSTSEPTKEDKTLKKGDRVTYESGKYYYTSAGDSPTGTKKRGKKVYVTKIKKGAKYPIHISTGSSLGDGDLGWLKEKQLKFDTGGYTGDWAGNDGKTAILHKKELVLNAKDTENVLATVNIVRDMQSMIDSLNNSILSRTNGFMDSINASLGFDTNFGTDLNQQVSIQASFPNVSSRMEIEQAFENLVNLASQHAFDTRR